MKKIALLSAIVLGGLFTEAASAQIGVSLGFHFGGHRIISPVAEVAVQTAPDYYAADDYYYLPDVDAYYSVTEQCYYYNDGYNWVSAAFLPGYRDHDWRNARRFEVRARRPYLNDDFYRSRYEGHTNTWGRAKDRVYADRNDTRGYRNDEYRNDNRAGWNNHDRVQDDRFNRDRGFNQPQSDHSSENYGNRGGNNFDQPMQPNRNEGRQNSGNFNQPAQPNMNQGNMGQRSNDGRGRGGNFSQPAQPNMDKGNMGQPSNGGRERGGNNGGQQAPANNGQGNQAQPSNSRGNGSFRGEMHVTDNQIHGGVQRFARS